MKVNEKEYDRWHEEEWNKYEPQMFSKIIGGIVYTAQAFYHGDSAPGKKFQPFTIFYSEGRTHKIFYFRNWLLFKGRFEKLISKLHKIEIQQPTTLKLRSGKASGMAVRTSIGA